MFKRSCGVGIDDLKLSGQGEFVKRDGIDQFEGMLEERDDVIVRFETFVGGSEDVSYRQLYICSNLPTQSNGNMLIILMSDTIPAPNRVPRKAMRAHLLMFRFCRVPEEWEDDGNTSSDLQPQ